MAAGVSARFRQMVTGSYQLVSRVEVLNPAGAVILDSANPATPLNVTGGRIAVDGSASIRRNVSGLTIVDPTGTLVPAAAADYFSALSNNEIRLSVGIIVDGAAEWTVQGYFPLDGAQTNDEPGNLTISLSAYDRAIRYSRKARVTPKVFDASASTPIYTAITQLLQDAVPGTVVHHDSPVHLTPSQTCDTGADPWEFARELAESMGYELFFDRLGECRLRAVPDPNNAALVPAWVYQEGVDSALLSVGRAQERQGIYSGVIVTGENPSNGSPVRAVVWDTDINSPTYYLGPFGAVPDFIQSDKVRTLEQATAAGVGRLNKVKGMTETVRFSIVPNPAIEPGDAIRVVRARSKLPVSGPGSGALIVDSFDIGLAASDGQQTIDTRQRRL